MKALTGSFLVLLLIFVAVIVVVCAIIVATKKKQPSVAADDSKASYFDGTTLQLIGYRLLTGLLTGITLGIAFPWAYCMLLRWEIKHTVINGRRLRFVGRGLPLLGRYLLWAFLSVLTLGIYSLWFGLNLKKWVVANTLYEDEDTEVESFFSGGIGGYIGIHLLAGLLTFFTLGIGAAWGQKMILEWEAKHTHIGGSPLVFSGTGGQLFGKYLLFILLTPLTLGIYAIFYPVRILRWKYSHTDAVYQTAPIQARARAHEEQARQDYAQFRLAANDTELSVMKSGITYKETPEELEALAQSGNRYAMYQLSLLKQQESDTEAQLHWLKLAADQNYHPAMLDYAQKCLSQDQDLALKYLEGAARNGNCEAPWLLACFYGELGTADALLQQVYWFKVALEWNDANALENQPAYNALIKCIACLLSENSQPPARSAGAVIAAVVSGVLLLLMLLGAVSIFLLGRPMVSHKEPAPYIPQQATVGTVAPTRPTEAPTRPTASTGIVGTWRNARRDGNSIYIEDFTLNKDGTCRYFSQRYDHTHYAPLEGESGWYVPPMGWPDYRGTYTYADRTLTMNLVNDYYLEQTIVYDAYIAEDGSLCVTEIVDGVTHWSSCFIQEDLDVWALCERLGVDTSVG